MAKYNNADGNIDPTIKVSEINSTIKQEIIKKLLHDSFQNNKTKISNDALNLVVEIAKCLVTETCLRASVEALRGESDLIDCEHVEKCLPQLMLDFP